MRQYLALAVAPLIIYPLAIALVIGVDTGLGDAEFLRSFMFESKRATAQLLLSDWLAALPWCLLIWTGVRIAGLWLNSRQQHLLLLLIGILLLAAALSDLYLPLLFAALALSTLLVNLAYLGWLTPSRSAQ